MKRQETTLATLYLAPAGLVLLVFWFAPAAASLVVSFTNWEGADTLDIVGWVGWRNYARTLGDERFTAALANTINYALWSIPITMSLGLGAALLVQRKTAGASIFRTVFFLPYVTTWVAVSIAWQYFFDPETGPLNHLIRSMGFEPLRWLAEPRGVIEMFATGPLGFESWPNTGFWGRLAAGPSLAMASIILTTIWRDVGFFMVVFLAGLANIDPGYAEAAMIDGASAPQRLRRITLPLLAPTTYFLLIIAVIGAFRVFVPIMVMTPGGGPAKSTATLVYYMYEKGFVQWKLGLGSAVGYLLFMIILIPTLAQARLFGRRVHYDG